MPRFTSLPRPVLLTLAVLFATATVLYSVLWMYGMRWLPPAELGANFFQYSPRSPSLRISDVLPGSPAEQAGLRMDDRIVALNGRSLEDLKPFYELVMHGRPGDRLTLTVEPSGATTPITTHVTLQEPNLRKQPDLTATQTVALQVLYSFPVLFLIVGLPVLFLRLQDRNAWLLAVLFGAFIAAPELLEMQGRFPASLRGFALAYHVILGGLLGPLFYYFFAVFPISSPLDRRLPWLKSVLVGATALAAVPLGLWALLSGTAQPLLALTSTLGEKTVLALVNVYGISTAGLGLVSLVWSSMRATTAEARRRTRVILWGTVVGVTPILLLELAGLLAQRPPYSFLFWIWAPSVLALFLLPVSFAYAVVKHRALEIPVLLRQSARYLLVQRGFTFLIILSSLTTTLLFGFLFVRLVVPRVEFAVPASVGFGVFFGLLLAWAGAQVERRVTERIDRAFFRRSYDARHILEDLTEKTRMASDREELAALLERHLREALYPASLAIYLEASDGLLRVQAGSVPLELRTLHPQTPELAELARCGQPQEWSASEEETASEHSVLARLQPECLVPIVGRDAGLTGLLVLGPRLSEEPYSGEDRRLLAAVATQAGVAVDSIQLAERMASQLEAERRTAHEIEIAKKVQSKLLPQAAPRLETLEYTGACIQARQVGGDYYDYLDLGNGRVSLVQADISGKGISAAMLMASLQANLRSQHALARDDLARLLRSVNRLFYESTEPGHFATIFFGTYDDATRRLRYANCGHGPPFLLKPDGKVERLDTTATVLGLFEQLDPAPEEVQLAPGDLLVVYTDGITEAMSDEGEEFGEERLLHALEANRELPVPSLLSTIVATVEKFSGREQEDDLTLLVARAR